MPRRFVHAADLHLDSPFAGVGALRDGLDERLRDASLEVWDRLVALCLDEDAAFLLIAGDLFDSDARSPRAERRVRTGLERLAEAGIPTFIVHGNHDPLGRGVSYGGVQGVTVFRAGRPQTATLDADGAPVAIHGVSFGRQAETDNLAALFARGDAPGLHIGVLHCMVGGAAGHDDYAPCTLDDLRRAGMDYWALGHVHEPQELASDPPVVYAGTTQGRSPRPGDRGPRGAWVVEFDGARIGERRHVVLDEFRFALADVPIAGLTELADLERALEGAADAALAEADGRLVILRARLTGRGPLHPALGVDACESLRQALDDDAPPALIWERIEDATALDIDLDAIRREETAIGDVARMADEIAASPGLAALLAEWEGELPDRAARGIAAVDPAGRVAAARDRALGILLDDGVDE